MKIHIARTYIVTWLATDAKSRKIDRKSYSSKVGSSKNGLVRLHTIRNQPAILTKFNTGAHGIYIIISFEYFGPDTFSNTLGLGLCQYGGLWILGYNNKDFPAKTKLFQHCSLDKITHMELYITWEYTIIAVVQYNGISTSKGEYKFDTHKCERETIRFYATWHHSEQQRWSVQQEINVLQILARLRDAATVHFGNSYSKPFQLTFWFHSPEKHCSCQVEIYSKQEWCSTEGLAHSEKLVAPVVYRDGTDPVNISFFCNKCNFPAFIYFSMTPVSSFTTRLGKTHLGSFNCKQTNYILVDPQTCNQPLHRPMQYAGCWDIWIRNRDNIAINISFSARHKNYFELINVRLNIQLQECNNNTKVLRHYAIKVGENINLFTQNSIALFSVAHLEEHPFDVKYCPIETFVCICPINNNTIDGQYWTPKMTER